MQQMILGAVLVGMRTVIGALSTNTNNGITKAHFAPPMLFGICLNLVTRDGSSMQVTDVYVRVTWTRRV